MQSWCKFGATLYRSILTIFTISNGIAKTPRDKSKTFYKNSVQTGFLFFWLIDERTVFLTHLARTEVDKGQAFVIRTKNSYQLFLRLRRRPHSSRRDNFDFVEYKNAPIFRSIFYYLFENIEINPLRDFRYVANATRYSCRSICLLRKREIYLISSLSEVKAYRICR